MSNIHPEPEANVSDGAIQDGAEMYARRRGYGHWKILHIKDGEANTAYTVNVDDLTCSCPDEDFNREGDEVCKHLAYALFSSNDVDLGDHMAKELSDEVREARQTLREIQAGAMTQQAGQTTETDSGPSEASDGDTETTAGPQGPTDTDAVRDWIGTGFAKPELVEVRVGNHGDQPGWIVEPDNREMPDHVFESFKGLINSLEDSTVHVGFGDDPCQTCNEQDGEYWYHIPENDSSEVWD